MPIPSTAGAQHNLSGDWQAARIENPDRGRPLRAPWVAGAELRAPIAGVRVAGTELRAQSCGRRVASAKLRAQSCGCRIVGDKLRAPSSGRPSCNVVHSSVNVFLKINYIVEQFNLQKEWYLYQKPMLMIGRCIGWYLQRNKVNTSKNSDMKLTRRRQLIWSCLVQKITVTK